MPDLTGQKVAVFGMGLSGRAAARLAVSAGADVVAFDTRPGDDMVQGVPVRRGVPSDDAFVDFDVVVVSPGLAADQRCLHRAARAGARVVGELGFAADWLKAPVIAITGTNGKSTLTHFTGILLGGAEADVSVVGNIGTPVSDIVRGSPRVVVVEVSSYQLELPGALHPRVAVVTNLTEDHLARHGTMQVYGETKVRLLRALPDDGHGFVDASNPLLVQLTRDLSPAHRLPLHGLPGIQRDGTEVRVQLDGRRARFDLSPCTVAGEHNLDHAATAAALAFAVGEPPDAIQARVGSLRGLPHRMEIVPTTDGVLWINDSKATNVEASRVAVDGLDRPAVVLLGGEAKGESLEPLADGLRKAAAVVCFGGSGPELKGQLDALGLASTLVPTMEAALELARDTAQPGQAVLLSPAGASFDAFDNFGHRGDVFRRWVEETCQ